MKNNKLKLHNLKVKSFITNIDLKKIKGGIDASDTEVTHCEDTACNCTQHVDSICYQPKDTTTAFSARCNHTNTGNPT